MSIEQKIYVMGLFIGIAIGVSVMIVLERLL